MAGFAPRKALRQPTAADHSWRGDARDVVHPEVLIAVDSAFMGQFKDHLTLLRYLVVSMNSVNVRYLTIRNPGVQLKLCAVEVFNEYYESFLYKVDNYVAGRMSLNRLIDYVQQYYSKYAEYDAVYFITGLDIARFTGYYWDATQQGMAYVGGACTARKVALGEDKAMTYKGVRISSHEFGHLFGCPHDGQKYMGYNSERCPWNDGFIMSYVENDSRSSKFSPCCNDMIRRCVNSVEGRCLRTRNARRKIKKSNFTKDLPGDDVGRDQFCQLSFPEVQNTYVLPDNGIGRCHVRCFMPDDITSVGYKKVFLPDNSPCNESGGSVCINGDCVNKKPKYVFYQPTK
ncbi:snake venom metalloproteinase lebetase-4-like [Dermacentor silvarum]|uniref:snake venom metalloproteinase lebetase-4-like n=1 Tax=Dermacentor silvarum TaxID=543639 RepID=UPI002100A3BB|nr:snake venom metalloproteinase lebetase-4-like [Dermacentor silvarum]